MMDSHRAHFSDSIADEEEGNGKNFFIMGGKETVRRRRGALAKGKETVVDRHMPC